MRLRTILMVLALLAVASTAAGAFYYFFSLRENELAAARRQALSRTEMVRNLLTTHLSENVKTVRILAGVKEISQALLTPDEGESLAGANQMLDHFRLSLEVAVCYLMDAAGDVIASSNRHDPDSFMGKNFSFRPYFKEAVAGAAGKFFALGTTSMRRGAYFSHPVSRPGSDEVLGVVVIKVPITKVEQNILGAIPGITLVTGPYDVIFGANRQNWLLGTLWSKTPEDLAAVAASRQFGEGPWPWVGMERLGPDLVGDRQGRQFIYFSLGLPHYPGWKVVHLKDLSEVTQAVINPLAKTTGVVVLGLCFFAGLSVFFLIRKADHEIARREEAEADLRRSEERYRFLYHHTPALLHSIDAQGRLIGVSDYWSEALGYKPHEVIGRPLTDFLTPASRRLARDQTLPGFFSRGWCQDEALRFVKKDGSVVEVLLSAVAEKDAAGHLVSSLSVFKDVTRLKRAQEDLRQAQEQLSLYSKDLERQVRQRTREITGILQYTPAVIYMKDREGRYVLLNSRWQELFGLPAQEVQGKTVYDVFPKDAADVFRKNDLLVLSTKRPFQSEEIFPVGDRTYNYLSVRFPVLDESGEVIRLCGISVDITDLKKAQDRLRRLSSSIMASQENERTAIARELHDELGQVLTVLRMDAVWLRDHLGESDPAGARRSRNMCQLIDRTISDVRHIATRLRPPALDDLGLVDALEWYTNDFEKRTGIACVFTPFDLPEVRDFTALAAYRVTQEALTNVARHSGATNVDVSLRVAGGQLQVAVVDNGSGFDLERVSEQECLGLTGMRERAALAGGSLVIHSAVGQGTEILLALPLPSGSGVS